MALRWMEGFEVRQHSDYFGRLYTYAGAAISAGITGRRHGSGIRGAVSSWITPALVGAVESTWILQFAIRKPSRSSLSSSTPGFIFRDGSDNQLEVRIVDAASPQSGMFQIQLLRGATVLATSPVYDSGDTARSWHVFQLKVTIDPAAGAYEMKHWDYAGTETTAITAATSQNTAEQGTAGADVLLFRTGTSGAVNIDLDDIVVMDNTGGTNDDFTTDPIVVLGELPTAEGTTNDWTPSSGSDNADLVNDAATSPGESGEVTAAAVDTVDLYDFTQAQLALAPTASPPAVLGVMVDVEAAMKNAGTANLRVEVRDGMDQATDSNDLTFSGTAKQSKHAILEENPTGTPAPWTIADLTSAEIGVRYAS